MKLYQLARFYRTIGMLLQGGTPIVAALQMAADLLQSALRGQLALASASIGAMFELMGWERNWFSSALGARLPWTLPFGLLIMFAVFSRFNRAYEEAARDLGASNWMILWTVGLPILIPGIIAVALFGFTLSYDEFPRTMVAVGPRNTLPLEIWVMTTNVTSPALFALGTVTTAVSFLVITLALGSMM